MKHWRIALLRTGFPALLLAGMAGCSAPEPQTPAEMVAQQLEPGGSVYSVSLADPVRDGVAENFRELERAVAASRYPQEKKQRIQSLLSVAELTALLLRSEDLLAAGYSSRPAAEGVIRNRFYALFAPESQSVMLKLPGTVNRPLIGELAGLPETTFAAADFILDGKTLLPLLDAIPQWQEKLRMFCGEKTGLPFDAIMEVISGEYGVALYTDPVTGKTMFAIIIPAPNGIFKMLRQVAGRLPGWHCSELEVRMPQLPGGRHAPQIVNLFGQIAIFSSPEAQKLFLDPGKTLGETEDFQRLSAVLPGEGLGIFYTDPGRMPPEMQTVSAGKLTVNFNRNGKPELGILRREPQGLLWVGSANCDWNKLMLRELAALPVMILGKLQENTAPKRSTAKAVPAAHHAECRANLEKLREALNQYAAKHNGAMPAAPGTAGLRALTDEKLLTPEMLRCPDDAGRTGTGSYVYFGAWKNPRAARLPLAADRPGNHSGSVNVLFTDGSTETLELANCRSVRRLCSFLHTRLHYDEADFIELMRRAAMLDEHSEPAETKAKEVKHE